MKPTIYIIKLPIAVQGVHHGAAPTSAKKQRLQLASVKDGKEPSVKVDLHKLADNRTLTPHSQNPTRVLHNHPQLPYIHGHVHTIHARAENRMLHALKKRVRKEEVIEEAKEALDYLSEDFDTLCVQLMKLCVCGMSKVALLTMDRQLLGELVSNHLRATPFLRGFDVRLFLGDWLSCRFGYM